jgi:hypothetical protein
MKKDQIKNSVKKQKNNVSDKKTSKNNDKIKTCIKNKIRLIMREFKNKELFANNGTLVSNPKQAIAIALNMSKKTCDPLIAKSIKLKKKLSKLSKKIKKLHKNVKKIYNKIKIDKKEKNFIKLSKMDKELIKLNEKISRIGKKITKINKIKVEKQNN